MKTPREVVLWVANQTSWRSGILFTGASTSELRPPPYASKLKTYIEKNNLGTVHKVPSFRNKNTSRMVTTYLWVVNQSTLANFK